MSGKITDLSALSAGSVDRASDYNIAIPWWNDRTLHFRFPPR